MLSEKMNPNPVSIDMGTQYEILCVYTIHLDFAQYLDRHLWMCKINLK